MVLEASGVDETADGAAGEVSESQGDAAQVLEASVDDFGRAVWRSRGDRSRPGLMGVFRTVLVCVSGCLR